MKPLINLLFVIGVLCTFVFGGAQSLRLQHVVQGYSWYLLWTCFSAINLFLAIPEWRAKRTWQSVQLVISHSSWLLMALLDLGALIGFNTGVWSHHDTYAIVAAMMEIGTTVLIKHIWFPKLSLTDPILRGWYAAWFRAVPHVMLALTILNHGNMAVTGIAIVMGHVTITIRLTLLWITNREVLPKNRKNIWGSLLSEFWNETSWIAVICTWFIAGGSTS